MITETDICWVQALANALEAVEPDNREEIRLTREFAMQLVRQLREIGTRMEAQLTIIPSTARMQ